MEGQETLIGSDIKICRARKPWKRELNTLEITEIEIWVDKEIERRFKARDRANSIKGLAIMFAWGLCLMVLMNIKSMDGFSKMVIMAAVCGGFAWLMITKDGDKVKEKEDARKALLQEKIRAAENS